MNKQCGCGRQYDSGEWKLLPYVGEIDDEVERLELRNCSCKSTLAIVLGPSLIGMQPTEAP